MLGSVCAITGAHEVFSRAWTDKNFKIRKKQSNISLYGSHLYCTPRLLAAEISSPAALSTCPVGQASAAPPNSSQAGWADSEQMLRV